MSFLKALWSFAKSHPIGSIVVLLVVPLALGGIAVSVYRAVKGAVAKVAPGVANAMPEK